MDISPQNTPEQLIATALKLSRYARRLTESDAAALDRLHLTLFIPWDAAAMQAILDDCAIDDEATLKKALRILRKQVMLRLIVRDLSGLADLREVMSTATLLAEVTTRFALSWLDNWLRSQYGPPIGEESGSEQDLVVVGMGKLGGGELNVSSDIDLIFAYPEEGETTGPRKTSNHEYFALLGKKLIGALNETTQDGFVFRVDMRLRPYGDSGPLVGSFSMLENYYLTQGREWERYAWIKGRPLTGSLYQELADILRPFVFRKYLDFGAFASMRGLHTQIRQEVNRRDMQDNIKLGPGGIREIEFIAQVFQLIRGGKETDLQTRSTLVALDLIEQRNLLPAQTVTELRNAYFFLRNLEHRLQYLEDAQTQTLPGSDADRQIIAAAMGYAGWPEFLQALDTHRNKVERHFEQVFAAPQSSQSNHSLAALWQGAPAEEDAIALLAEQGYHHPAETWLRLSRIREGSRYNQLPTESRTRFDSLLPPLIQVACNFPNPDETLERILHLVENISRRGTYLALLVEYPQTLNQVAKLCSASPWVSGYLTQHPILLDELLDTRELYARYDREKLRHELKVLLHAAEGDTERQMDIMRHFKQAQTFRLVAQDLAGALPLEILSDQLSDLADMILDETLRLAWAGLRVKHRDTPRFAIIAYGKLGGKELGYASDLDIIFLYNDDSPDAAENYAKLAQRINSWISSMTPAGILYETDLRLRPNGASGLLVSSVEAFEDYQKNQAWVWEHQALTRARFSAGDTDIGAAFERIRIEVLRQEREPATLREEVLKMRQKMLDAHPNPGGLFDIKHDRGGIIDVEFIVQYLVLNFSCLHPELTRDAGNLALLRLAGELKLIPLDLAEQVRDTYREYRLLQHQLRLQGGAHARIDPEQAEEHAAAVKQLWRIVLSPES
ncbi:MAG: bifunctional [glutamate--ammonia ligase]-adenylyl-L-tyrosine phosphorylase/[glutamate--ammonia-ligase] adenylyltransferase [Gammaproteobacteria bacterium]|nr:bifunctional [glutamate--ammonia ligase]-adenylyl-L-tyrosine phosphorylase/[glutamate--ammonia-ligase] adenylyltransferase [Gammaproteobacteria bacterium]MBU1979891.1 bifunctional [glutamate--ammonia ligase]-adenylyl-L-tyrosine phosphorylase/[glutamate--ammonia-ligase] adenylyltransferase [Gammaproteobacteria bacterium]